MATSEIAPKPPTTPAAEEEPEVLIGLTPLQIRLVVTMCEQTTCGDKGSITVKNSLVGKLLPHFVDGPRPPGR